VNVRGDILAFNSGSSSLKFQLFGVETGEPRVMLKGVVREFGERALMEVRFRGEAARAKVAAAGHGDAAARVIDIVSSHIESGQSLLSRVAAVGHRFVHGGECFVEPTPVTAEVIERLDELGAVAPLHNPPALAVLRACRERLEDIPMIAVFDTAFFSDLPDYARVYALPAAWMARTPEIHRYGFHGLAHRYMFERCCAVHGLNSASARVVTLQLGNGCSAAAVHGGRAVDTSMGFTPMEGLIMSTRPGDVDAGALLHLLERVTVTAAELGDGLNHRAGLLGLSGVSGDMQELLELEAGGHAGAQLAVRAFCHRARKYLGAYLAVLGGADAIVFGGGIGEHAAEIRARICAGMEWCGIEVDAEANRRAAGREARISTAGSRTAVYVLPVDEEAVIARDTLSCLNAVGE